MENPSFAEVPAAPEAARVTFWGGRAHRLLEPVVRAIGERHAAGGSAYLIVPEQYTLQGERELMRRLGLSGLFDLQVLSPTRLQYRVLQATGADSRQPLSTAGRQIALSRAVADCREELLFYRRIADYGGFCERMTSLLTDMKRGGVTAEAFAAYAETLPDDARGAKMRDVARIYTAYERVLSGRLADGEEQSGYVAARMRRSGFVDGRHLFVYGFDMISDQLAPLLLDAAPLCASMTIALLMDRESAPDGALYTPVRASVARFRERLRARGVASRLEWLPDTPLAAAPAIAHLERSLFAWPRAKFEGRQTAVAFDAAQSPYEEAALAARQILALEKRGVKLSEIVLLHPDDPAYAFAVPAALTDYAIPFFTDEPLPMRAHPLTRCLLAALSAATRGFQAEDVTRMIKSGYSTLSPEEGCALLDYAAAVGVGRGGWRKPFTRGDADRARAMETLRAKLLKPAERLRDGLRAAADAASSLSAVFQFLLDIDAHQTLLDTENILVQNGLYTRVSQNGQVWDAILALLSQINIVLDGARAPMKHIVGWFESGFSGMEIQSLPPMTGTLAVGRLGHLMPGDARALFALGLSDGVLSRDSDSLFSDEERLGMERALHAAIGMTDETRATFAKLDLKSALSIPAEYLALSCAQRKADGSAQRPMSAVEGLLKELMTETPRLLFPLSELPTAPAAELTRAALRLGELAEDGLGEEALTPPERANLARLAALPDWSERVARVRSACAGVRRPRGVSPDTARRLFLNGAQSAGRLEAYARCPFAHFVRYGLRPVPREEWRVEPLDTGNYYHAALDAFSRLAAETPDYPHIDDDAAMALAERALAPLDAEALAGPMGDGARNLRQYRFARDTARRAMRVVTRQLRRGAFRVQQTEAVFGEAGGPPPLPLKLPDGREVPLRGRIDRVDHFDDGDDAYLRVIDYKSGVVDFSAAKAWWGLQLQLPLYLNAALQAERASAPDRASPAQPAGAFYFHVADPLADCDGSDPAEIEHLLAKELRLRGIALAEPRVIAAMETPPEGGDMESLPRMLKGDGTTAAGTRAYSRAELAALLSHATRTAEWFLRGIASGDASDAPMRMGDECACDLCDHRAACGRDERVPGLPEQRFPEIGADAVREALSREAESPPADGGAPADNGA